MDDRCSIDRCRREVGLIYLGHGVCTYHWDRLTAEDVPPERLRMVLGIEAAAPTAMEEPMSETTPAAENAAQEGTMAEKKTQRKAARKKAPSSKTAKPAPAKAKKEKAPKKKRPPKEDLVVFAFRLTEAERDAIHKTAGPARATRFIRAVAAAFAREDEGAFKTVVKEAREAKQ